MHAVERLEIQEIRIVDHARDHLAHVVGPAIVDRHDPGELVGIVARLLERFLRPDRQLLVPRQLGHDLAGEAHAVGIVLGQIFAEPGDRGVHFGAAELLIPGDLAGGGAQQRRACEKHFCLVAHQDHVIGKAGQIGAACRR